MRYLGEQLARAGFAVARPAPAGPRDARRGPRSRRRWPTGPTPSRTRFDALRAACAAGSRSSGSRSAACSRCTSRSRRPDVAAVGIARRAAVARRPRRAGRATGPRAAAARARLRAAQARRLRRSRPRVQRREPLLHRRSRSRALGELARVHEARRRAQLDARARSRCSCCTPRSDHTAPVACAARIAERTRRRAHADPAAQLPPDRGRRRARHRRRRGHRRSCAYVLTRQETPMRHVIAIDQGTTGSTVLVLDEQLAAARPRLQGVPPDLSRSRAGSSTIPRTSGRRVLGALGAGARDGHRRRRRSRRSASRTSARPRSLWDRTTGKAAAQRDRLAGPPHRRPLRRAQGRGQGGARPRAHRPDARSVLLGHQDQLDARQRRRAARARARSGELAFGTIDCYLLWRLTGGAVARDRRHERVAHAAVRPARRSRGATSCCELLGVPRALLPEVVAVVGTVRHDAAACPGCPTASRSRASPAISRRRCSARRASRPATRSARTAPARSS